MSRNSAVGSAIRTTRRKPDRRATKTRDRLGDALVALMQERPFESITVQQVLDRAGIGRSTFYSHYRGKEDLLFSDVDDFWEKASTALWRVQDSSNRVAPVRELFSHVAEVREFYNALVASGRMHDVMELGQAHFAKSIEERLARKNDASSTHSVAKPSPVAESTRRATAHALAGAMFSLLAWWIHHPNPLSADAMDALFHALVWRGATGSCQQFTRSGATS